MDQCWIGDWLVKVGDVVQFKTIEDIFEEFGGYNEYDVIDGDESGLHAGFNKDMEHMCGEVFTIRSITDSLNYYAFHSVENIEAAPSRVSGYWIISDSMIKPYDEPSEVSVHEDDFLNVLLGE